MTREERQKAHAEERRREHEKLVAVQAELATLRSKVERLTETLQAIEGWSRAYPLAAFPEPDLVLAHMLLKAGGMNLDAISAHAMRHVITEVGKMARAGLEAA
jgi:hypothetical protein